MDAFDLGVSTILHCFVADKEMFSEYAGNGMKRFVEDWDRGGRVMGIESC